MRTHRAHPAYPNIADAGSASVRPERERAQYPKPGGRAG